MANNELVLLDQVLAQRQAERTVPIKDDDAFELFACEQVMRDRDLSPEEVASGITGGGNDGGLDGVYVFLDNTLLTDEHEIFEDGFTPSRIPSGARLELWLIQAKREESFSETAVEKVADSSGRLLSLSESIEDLGQLYNSQIVTRTGYLRDALRTLATRHPRLAIHFVYATRGRASEVNTKVKIKGQSLELQFSSVIPGATGSVAFLGASELWQKANATPSYTVQLTYQENATSGSSHVALVKLSDYMNFLRDENKELRKHIFDWNVRDYEGDVEVNREIRQSLIDGSSPEFWWLNNGVTIVCSKASSVGKTYSLDDVQVVNGLQTSHTIFTALQELPDDHPAQQRAVLVRILVTSEDTEARDRVIRATNRQTTVQAASLRATDEIQRNIESYFYGHGWYYDRRKNYYRNNGKSPERIISISLLAQAVMAMGLGRPDNSRARPSSLLKRDDDYKTAFSATIPLEIYLWLAESQKTIDTFLISEATTQERTNLRFHVAMAAAVQLVGKEIKSPMQLRPVVSSGQSISDADLDGCLTLVRSCFVEFGKGGDAPDKIAKGPDFVKYVTDCVVETIGSAADAATSGEEGGGSDKASESPDVA